VKIFVRIRTTTTMLLTLRFAIYSSIIVDKCPPAVHSKGLSHGRFVVSINRMCAQSRYQTTAYIARQPVSPASDKTVQSAR